MPDYCCCTDPLCHLIRPHVDPSPFVMVQEAQAAALVFARDVLGDDHVTAVASKLVDENQVWVLLYTAVFPTEASARYGVIMNLDGREWIGDDINILTPAEYESGVLEEE